jgi:hypothetical protein
MSIPRATVVISTVSLLSFARHCSAQPSQLSIAYSKMARSQRFRAALHKAGCCLKLVPCFAHFLSSFRFLTCIFDLLPRRLRLRLAQPSRRLLQRKAVCDMPKMQALDVEDVAQVVRVCGIRADKGAECITCLCLQRLVAFHVRHERRLHTLQRSKAAYVWWCAYICCGRGPPAPRHSSRKKRRRRTTHHAEHSVLHT